MLFEVLAFPFCHTVCSSDQYRHVSLWSGLYLITLLKFQAELHLKIYTEIPSCPCEANWFRLYLFAVQVQLLLFNFLPNLKKNWIS